MKARDIMTRDVISISPETTIEEIAKILHKHRISGVPVVSEDNEILGMVTEGDLIIKIAGPHLPPHIDIFGGILFLKSPHDMDEEFKKITAVMAKDIMTEKVVVIEEDCDVSDLASIMINRKINRLPVVDKNDRLVGIISRADLIETMINKDDYGKGGIHQDAHIPDAP